MVKLIKIGLLTSSRADYGVYKPLLKKLAVDARFDLTIIAFGTHLLKKFGLTVQEIEQDNFGTILKVQGMAKSDRIISISKGFGKTVKEFAKFWNENEYDWVIALGDRFEMAAAVQAAIPFELNIAHLHGGETTLGAIDNIYRHQISLASKLHFVAAEDFKNKVTQLIDSPEHVHNVGAISLDDIMSLTLPTWPSVCEKFNIPLEPFVLVTFHPETVGVAKNEVFVREAYKALETLAKNIHIVVTMSNADAMASLYRQTMAQLKESYPKAFSLIENFGRLNYFAAMTAASYLVGNTSSGIVEAASFNKYVVNVGDRQKGRLRSENVIDVPFNSEAILHAATLAQQKGNYEGVNRFYQPNAALKIIETLAHAQL